MVCNSLNFLRIHSRKFSYRLNTIPLRTYTVSCFLISFYIKIFILIILVNYIFINVGQSVQYVGMAKDLYEKFDLARRVFDEVDEVLGFNLKELIFNGKQVFFFLSFIIIFFFLKKEK